MHSFVYIQFGLHLFILYGLIYRSLIKLRRMEKANSNIERENLSVAIGSTPRELTHVSLCYLVLPQGGKRLMIVAFMAVLRGSGREEPIPTPGAKIVGSSNTLSTVKPLADAVPEFGSSITRPKN
jgi:hypothetical protein